MKKNSKTLLQLCRRYDLGGPLSIKEIQGSRLHQTHHLRTTQGEYAIKTIHEKNLIWLQSTLLNQIQAQEVAIQMQRHGVPTVMALSPHDQDKLALNDEAVSYLITPWIEGDMMTEATVTPQRAETIGMILALIHQANIKGSFNLPYWRGLLKEEWVEQISRHKVVAAELSHDLCHHLEKLIAWSEAANRAQKALTDIVVVSHRDFDLKNVIWQGEHPHLLDWEYAGLIHPTLDLLIVALNWSGVLTDRIDPLRLTAVLRGYHRFNDRKTLTDDIWAGYFGYCLDWLIYNLHRLPDPMAIKEIYQTLNALKRVENQKDEITTGFNSFSN